MPSCSHRYMHMQAVGPKVFVKLYSAKDHATKIFSLFIFFFVCVCVCGGRVIMIILFIHFASFNLQIYAGSFFAIPLIRWVFVQRTNAKIDKRNRARQERARALELPDLSLRRKVNVINLLLHFLNSALTAFWPGKERRPLL